MQYVKEMFPDDTNEMLASDEFDIGDVNGKNCESAEYEFWIDIMLE